MLLLTPASAQEPAEPGWPREITVAEGSIVIYQPQPERLDGNALSSRAALSVTLTGSTTPSFGVVWVTSRVDTDLDSRSVFVLDVNVDRVRRRDSTIQTGPVQGNNSGLQTRKPLYSREYRGFESHPLRQQVLDIA